jgi:hypothetical protein
LINLNFADSMTASYSGTLNGDATIAIYTSGDGSIETAQLLGTLSSGGYADEGVFPDIGDGMIAIYPLANTGSITAGVLTLTVLPTGHVDTVEIKINVPRFTAGGGGYFFPDREHATPFGNVTSAVWGKVPYTEPGGGGVY